MRSSSILLSCCQHVIAQICKYASRKGVHVPTPRLAMALAVNLKALGQSQVKWLLEARSNVINRYVCTYSVRMHPAFRLKNNRPLIHTYLGRYLVHSADRTGSVLSQCHIDR